MSRPAGLRGLRELLEVPLDGELTIEVASDGIGESARWGGTLGPSQAVVLRPTSG